MQPLVWLTGLALTIFDNKKSSLDVLIDDCVLGVCWWKIIDNSQLCGITNSLVKRAQSQ